MAQFIGSPLRIAPHIALPTIDFRNDSRAEIDSKEQAFLVALQTHLREACSQELVGEEISTPHADGYARYMVVKASPFTIVHLPLGDAWMAPLPWVRGLRLEDARVLLQRRKGLVAVTDSAAPKLTLINVQLLRDMRPDIEQALVAVGKRHGVKFKTGNATCDAVGGTGHYKLEIAALTADGTEVDADAVKFRRFAARVGLSPDDFGKPLTVQGRLFTIAGYNPKAKKNCILVRSVQGKLFVISADTARREIAAYQQKG